MIFLDSFTMAVYDEKGEYLMKKKMTILKTVWVEYLKKCSVSHNVFKANKLTTLLEGI
jgi:hypothetical protein